MNRVLFWTPRILMILFIGFISLFALDSFAGNQSFPEKIGGFIIHLIPSAVLLFYDFGITYNYQYFILVKLDETKKAIILATR